MGYTIAIIILWVRANFLFARRVTQLKTWNGFIAADTKGFSVSYFSKSDTVSVVFNTSKEVIIFLL